MNKELEKFCKKPRYHPLVVDLLQSVEEEFNSYAAHVQDWDIEDEADYDGLLDSLVEAIEKCLKHKINLKDR